MPKFNQSRVIDSNPLTIINYRETIEIIKKDSSCGISSSITEYLCDENVLTYYVCINTWLLQIREYSLNGSLDFEIAIKHSGLISVIKECEKASDSLISGNAEEMPPYCFELVNDVKSKTDTSTWVKVMLQLLRYPKRLSPAGCDLLEIESLKKFQSIEKRNKLLDRKEDPYWLLDGMREVLAPLGDSYSSQEGNFSTGTCYDAPASTAAKILAAEELYPDIWFPYHTGRTVPRKDMTHYSEIQAVPKSYKARRIIAKEQAGTQYIYQGIRKGIQLSMVNSLPGIETEYSFSEFIKLEDQEQNRNLAIKSSILASCATIDLSSASDTVRASIARAVLPRNISRDIDAVRAPYYKIRMGKEKRTYPCYMYLTAGTACTFPIESLVFFSIGVVAIDLYNTLTGEDIPISPNTISVYGDDVIIDLRVHDTMVDLLTRLGFIVNTEKSFYTPFCSWVYRESCGAEYVNGDDVSTRYFSRKTLKPGDASSIAAMCDLQHRLADMSWAAARWLDSLVSHQKPDITYSLIGSDCSDLWTRNPALIKKSEISSFPRQEIDRWEKRGDALVWVLKDGSEVSNWFIRNHPSLLTRKREASGYEREVHLVCETVYNGAVKYPLGDTTYSEEDLRIAYDMWSYRNFLMSGPIYTSPLDRLLGVSSPRPNISKMMRSGSQVWRKSYK